ncbi:MAG TPA: LuxR C-terminal-related transcriptional regulator [Bacteroidia bacterium]|nr:LuxR C-terminal-related transcriptional regulator [Bacteroidia bacterium]
MSENHLTEREKEIVAEVAKGKTNKEIAAAFPFSFCRQL